jgi:hypothetical protein
MNGVLRRGLAVALTLALLTGLSACAITGGDYGEGGEDYDEGMGVSYFGGFYEPFGFGYGGWGPGYDYGGWGPAYQVGPPRGGMGRPPPAYGRPYRSAPMPRPMPSIPSRSRPR